MTTSLVPAPESPNLPSSLRTPGDRKVALWPTICPQSCGFSADTADENSGDANVRLGPRETSGDAASRGRARTPCICVLPFTCRRPAGCDWRKNAVGARRGHGPRRPRVPGAGHCEDWPTGPEGTGSGMPNSLWGCTNLMLAIAAELWRESLRRAERHGGCGAGVAGGCIDEGAVSPEMVWEGSMVHCQRGFALTHLGCGQAGSCVVSFKDYGHGPSRRVD